MMPSKDPKADELVNSNIRQPGETDQALQNKTEEIKKEEIQNGIKS
jgi:hypothetical protein